MDSEPVSQLTGDEWLKVFDEAEDIGISFILLAGGEPFLRKDIIEAAGKSRISYPRYLLMELLWMRNTSGYLKNAAMLAPGDAERAVMEKKMDVLRAAYDDVILLSFPGDELATDGCMAAGRGFFHINSHGGAEPCPFSPYSDINVRDTSLREAAG